MPWPFDDTPTQPLPPLPSNLQPDANFIPSMTDAPHAAGQQGPPRSGPMLHFASSGPEGSSLFHVLSGDTGERLASVLTTTEGNSLHIENIFGGEGPNSLGSEGIRSIVRQLKDFFPSISEIKGRRISGARYNGNITANAENAPIVSVPVGDRAIGADALAKGLSGGSFKGSYRTNE